MNISIKKKLPNILTTIRLLLVPVFVILILSKNYFISFIIFAFASITDFIDGYLARKWKVESKYGKVVDPIADKSLMITSLICLIKYNKLLIILIFLESLIGLMNYIYFKNGSKFYVAYIGKVKTTFLMITISYCILNIVIKLSSILEIVLIFITLILQISVLITYYINSRKNKK